MSKILGLISKIVLSFFIAFGLLLAMGFFAVRFGWTDVAGGEDVNSLEYNRQAEENKKIQADVPGGQASLTEDVALVSQFITKVASTTKTQFTSSKASLPESESIYGVNGEENWCKISVAEEFNSHAAISIFEAYNNTHSEILLNNMLLALKLRLPNRDEFTEKLAICEDDEIVISPDEIVERFLTATSSNLYSWQNGEPWQIIREAIIGDKEVIYRAAEEAGIQPRLLLSVAIVEQLRLYYTQRELFEKVFKPLKILANANKMAWGVMAIKEKMAIETEEHLKDINSAFYLGASSSMLLDFSDYEDDIEGKKAKERYARLTNKNSHYYSYLYGALILKQFQAQWEKAGYSIRYRPEIIATLFNIGFHNSEPKTNPKVGGSTIEIDGDKYYFGSLAFEFYYSGELSKEFPFE